MKRAFKSAVNALALVAALPFLVLYHLTRPVLGPTRAFQGCSQALSLFPGLTGVYLRRAFYRRTLEACGEDACISFGTIISGPGARIGRGVYTGAYCCLGEVALEDDVLLATGVSVMNGSRQHGIGRTDVPVRLQPGVMESVTIGRGSWIGERAAVLADVGVGCVIGTGAVVTKPVPDYAIAVGVPAKVVSYRDRTGGEVGRCQTLG